MYDPYYISALDHYDVMNAGSDWIEHEGAEDDGPASYYEYYDYARDVGYDNAGTEDAAITANNRYTRKNADRIGRDNTERLARLAIRDENHAAAQWRQRLERIKETRVPADATVTLENLTRVHYIQLDGSFTYINSKGKKIVLYSERLKKIDRPKRVFKRPLPAPHFYTVAGLHTKNSGTKHGPKPPWRVSAKFEDSLVQFDPEGKPLPFDALPKPQETHIFGHERGSQMVEYVWFVDRTAMNRLAHALNGNTPNDQNESPVHVHMCKRCDGDVKTKCMHHRHQRNKPESSSSPKKETGGPLKGAPLRIARKDSFVCNMKETCQIDGHYHAVTNIQEPDEQQPAVSAGQASDQDWALYDNEYDIPPNGNHALPLDETVHESTVEQPPFIPKRAMNQRERRKAKRAARLNDQAPVLVADPKDASDSPTSDAEDRFVPDHTVVESPQSQPPKQEELPVPTTQDAPPVDPVPPPPVSPPTESVDTTIIRWNQMGLRAPLSRDPGIIRAWDEFTALVSVDLYKAGLNNKRYGLVRNKINTYLSLSKIKPNTANVEQATHIIDQLTAAACEVIDGDGAFKMAYQQASLTERIAKDEIEGAARNLFILNPKRWYHELGRSIRVCYQRLRLPNIGFPIGFEIDSMRYDFPAQEPACCAIALEKWLSKRGKTMHDLLTNNLKDVLPAGMTFNASSAKLICSPDKPVPVGFTTQMSGLWLPRKNCWHNEALSVVSRQLYGVNPKSTSQGRFEVYDLGRRIATALWDNVGHVLPDPGVAQETYLKGKSKAQVRIFTNGLEKLVAGASIEYRAASFVKVEMGGEKNPEDRHPRCICGSHQDGTYIASIGPKYYAFQHECVRVLFKAKENPLDSFFVYTSGMSGEQVGGLIAHLEDLSHWVIEVDLKRCDGHNSVEARQAERRWYKDNGLDDETLEVLAHDDSGAGRTTQGFKFTCGSSQMSGRPDTSWGTSIRLTFVDFVYGAWKNYRLSYGHNASLISSWNKFYKWARTVKGFDSLIEEYKRNPTRGIRLGDDGAMAHAEEPDPTVIDFVYTRAGHEASIKIWAPDQYDHLTFCSSPFWDIGNGRRCMGNFPFHTLSKTWMNSDNTILQQDLPGFMRGVAMGFKHSTWIPVLGTVVMQLASIKADVRNDRQYIESLQYKIRNTSAVLDVDPSSVARHFEAIYGVPPSFFDYLREVDFTIPNSAWNLPGFREALACEERLDASLNGTIHSSTDHALNPFPQSGNWMEGIVGAMSMITPNLI